MRLNNQKRRETTLDEVLCSIAKSSALTLERERAQKKKKISNLKSFIFWIITLLRNAFEVAVYPLKAPWRNHYFRLSRLKIAVLIFRNIGRKAAQRIYYKVMAPNLKKLPNKYVYFPLHHQPERSSCPDGLFYSDRLFSEIGDTWKIKLRYLERSNCNNVNLKEDITFLTMKTELLQTYQYSN